MKKPIVVQLIGLGFIVSPFLSIVLTLKALGHSDWYTFTGAIQWIVDLEPLDQVWMALVLLSGLALNFPTRFSWMLALGSILSSLTLNLYRAASDLLSPTGSATFPLMSLLSAVGLFAVIYYFRYPYLDRREAWWGIDERFAVDMKCRMLSHGAVVGVVRNLSFSGMLFELGPLTQGMNLPLLGDRVELEFERDSSLVFKGRLVRVTESGQLGIQFDDFSAAHKKYLKNQFVGATALKA